MGREERWGWGREGRSGGGREGRGGGGLEGNEGRGGGGEHYIIVFSQQTRHYMFDVAWEL